MENIWEKSLSILRSEVNDQVYNAWFLSLHQVSFENNCLTLGVPNKFFENWIKEKYLKTITSSIEKVCGKPVEIKFSIIETPQFNLSTANQNISTDTTKIYPKENREDAGSKETPVNWIKSVFSGARNLPENKHKNMGLNPNYTFDNFVVGQSNRFAHAAVMAVCDNLAKVYNPLFLYGGVGLGKTHLMQAMGHEILSRNPKAKILYISSEEFTNQLISAIRNKTTAKFRAMYRNTDVLLLDDIQFIAGKNSTQEEFFHTFNALYDAHKQIVICSDRSPREIKDLEERLVTRFAWGLTADVQAPDFETRMAIMQKKSENEEVKVPKDVLYFLAENIKTNIREMEGALIRVVAYSKLTGIEITADLAKNVLKDMITAEENTRIDIRNIQKTVAEYFGIKEADMQTKKRTRSIAYPRQIAMYLSRELTDFSLPDIGGFFGGRDHTTVLHAVEKIKKELKETEKTRLIIDKLMVLIKK